MGMRGKLLPDELSVQALEVALMDMSCQTRGFILDGYPITRKQVDLMTERCIIPVRVIELQGDSREIVTRATADRYSPDKAMPQHDSPQILAQKMGAWNKEISAVRQWYQAEHNNIVSINGMRSKWWVWNKALEIGKSSVMQIQTYLQQIEKGNAASIAEMCITPSEFEARLGDFGQYCPVSYLDGKLRYEAILPGDKELVVEYKEKLYYFENEQKLDKFMRLPEKYANLKLPHKLPPMRNPLLTTSLPMLGYMEQSVSNAITKALTAVGNFKPKYPFLTPTRSSLLYAAMHLKAYNPRSSEYVRKKYKKKLLKFEETCELIKYLGDNMTKRYKQPEERPIDFDFKLEKFNALKAPEDVATWVS